MEILFEFLLAIIFQFILANIGRFTRKYLLAMLPQSTEQKPKPKEILNHSINQDYIDAWIGTGIVLVAVLIFSLIEISFF